VADEDVLTDPDAVTARIHEAAGTRQRTLSCKERAG
jgi:hypothetical protein